MYKAAHACELQPANLDTQVLMTSFDCKGDLLDAQDPVTHMAKFGGFYKRCGHRVLVSTNGDMIVRPSFLELWAHFSTGQLREPLLSSPHGCLSIALVQ